MEAVSMCRRAAAAAAARPEAFPVRSLFGEWARVGSKTSSIDFFCTAGRRCRPVHVGSNGARAEVAVEKNEWPATKKQAYTGPVQLFVGLPLDTVSGGDAVSHAKAIAAGMRALKLLGAHGVELPIYWAVAQPNSPDQFNWAGYLAVADMACAAGLRLRVSLHLHGSQDPRFPLPGWVARAAAADPDVLFTDRSGRRHDGCLSFAVDELPVLDGMTPLEAYEGFFRGFVEAFKDYFGWTITDVTVSLGPNGELRYPSFPPGTDGDGFAGIGEFQCYDKYMLAQLKRHAEESGHPLWGLSGPHDAPRYDESPDSGNGFFKDGGSWESAYGDFFLSWYARQLLGHGERVLALAGKVFGDMAVELSAKVPFLHWWHGTRSRPGELTAGFYNTDKKDGYDAVAEMFARHACTLIIPGMELLGNKQHLGARASPEPLFLQIRSACEEHGAHVAGENNSLVKPDTSGFARIKENLSTERATARHFTYQRMGAEFFSPEHWPMFMEFVRSVTQPETEGDDSLSNASGGLLASAGSVPGKDREMQAV